MFVNSINVTHSNIETKVLISSIFNRYLSLLSLVCSGVVVFCCFFFVFVFLFPLSLPIFVSVSLLPSPSFSSFSKGIYRFLKTLYTMLVYQVSMVDKGDHSRHEGEAVSGDV